MLVNISADKCKLLEGYLNERLSLFKLRLSETRSVSGGDYRYQLKSEIELIEGYLSMVDALKGRYLDWELHGVPDFEIQQIIENIRESIRWLEDALKRWEQQGGQDYQSNGWEGELDENYALLRFVESLKKE